jgi:hypothetical protein
MTVRDGSSASALMTGSGCITKAGGDNRGMTCGRPSLKETWQGRPILKRMLARRIDDCPQSYMSSSVTTWAWCCGVFIMTADIL